MTTCLDELKESTEFLNLLLSNINSAVLIVDENMEIHQFNDFFVELFDKSLDTFVEKSFGPATGCINAVLESLPCGETSHCKSCVLRHSLIKTMVEKVPVDNKTLDRIFYVDGEEKEKHLEFSTRPVYYQDKRLVLIVIHDISDIEQKKRELELKQQKLDEDLKAAAGIQQSLLPSKTPSVPNLNIAWEFEPCEQIGGDIFNIQFLDKNKIGFYMLDVCGHGVSASLIAVSVSQFLQSSRDFFSIQSKTLSPGPVLDNLNRAFPFERFDSYFSIVYTTLDCKKGILTYSCAGHPPPILITENGRPETLNCNGPVIGLNGHESFSQVERQLNHGDKIVLYTDGMVECRNRHGEIYGKDRFYETLEKFSNKPIQDMVAEVNSALKSYMKGTQPDDDISILAVEYGR